MDTEKLTIDDETYDIDVSAVERLANSTLPIAGHAQEALDASQTDSDSSPYVSASS